MKLPRPMKLSARCSRWSGDEVLEAERSHGIKLPDNIAGKSLTDRQLAERYGVHQMTIWKWARATGESQAA